jgi:primosomal protein N' (replication factor Y)
LAAIFAVAVPSPLRTLFDYLPPLDGPAPQPGARVRVPFGRGHKVGLVVACRTHSELDPSRLKRIARCLDAQPLLDPSLLALLGFTAEYFHHPPGDVLATMLPPLLRHEREPRMAVQREWVLTDSGRQSLLDGTAFGPLQRRLLDALARGPLVAADAAEAAAMRRLAARGLAAARARPARPRAAHVVSGSAPALNPHQHAVVAAVAAMLGGYAAFLLDGVTGSGKTEVYLALIEQVIASGRQTLVLIPEIGLTPQIVQRFRRHLGVAVAALHSGMAQGERVAAWRAARSGEAPVVVGTRSAVFTPLAQPGLIVVDEEHDLSYKQQEGLRYSARDLAVLRARQAGVPVLLGSASPSLESLHNARSGRYRALSLPQRAGAGSTPSMEVIDLRARVLEGGLSEPVRDALAQCLAAGEQAILFVNRRGYAPVLMCHACGAPVDCPRCDAHLVLHRAEARLRCHHCDHAQSVPTRCQCAERGALHAVGTGTQRVVEYLGARFPNARVQRVDRDSTRRRGAMEGLLEQVQAGAVDILVGTQMLAKGHDFPRVTLVAILDADGGLFSADFRASERMAQLLTQVSGRAGRGDRPGRVLIQTHQPQHPLLRTLITGGYAAFGEAALAERAAGALPPYTFLALLRAEAPLRERVYEFLDAARAAAPGSGGVTLLGPVPAPMERRAGRVRAQLLLEAVSRAPLHRWLGEWVPRLEALPAARQVRWSLDVDPQEMI